MADYTIRVYMRGADGRLIGHPIQLGKDETVQEAIARAQTLPPKSVYAIPANSAFASDSDLHEILDPGTNEWVPLNPTVAFSNTGDWIANDLGFTPSPVVTPGDSIETFGDPESRAMFGEFLTREGYAPREGGGPPGMRRALADVQYNPFARAFDLQQAFDLDPAANTFNIDPEGTSANAFEEFLSRQVPGQSRAALARGFQDVVNINPAEIEDEAQQLAIRGIGGVIGSPKVSGIHGRTALAESALALLRSSRSPLVRFSTPGAGQLVSQFHERSRAGEDLGSFVDFLRKRLGLDRLGIEGPAWR